MREMMRRYEKKQETYEHDALVEMRCDICGRSADLKREDWGEEEVSVRHRIRKDGYFSDESFGEEIEFDICPTCFREVLIPFLRSKGAKADYEPFPKD